MYGTFFKVFPKDIESYVLQNFVFIINQFITHLCSVQTHAKTCTRFLRIGRKSALNSLQSLIHPTYVALIVKLRDYCTFNRLRWAIDKYTNCSHGNGDDDDHDQFGPIPRAYIIHLSLHNCIRDISESHFPVGTSPCPTTPLTTDPHATPLNSPHRLPALRFDHMHVDGCLYYFAFFAIIFKQKHTKSICATIPQGSPATTMANEAKAKERWVSTRNRGWWRQLGIGVCGVEGANESN